MRRCIVRLLGRVAYAEAVRIQDAHARALKDARGGEQLLLLEHPPVITLGRSARPEDVLLNETALRAAGLDIAVCDRGGQVTYHGPGQLVGYPILNLHPDRRDVARYLRDLEEVILRTLATFGIAAERSPGLTGVWVGGDKIASIGVHLSRWVTTHGFALNVSTDLAPFGMIVPCGIRGRGVTSMARLLGAAPSLDEVAAALVPHFETVLGRAAVPPALDSATAASAAMGDVVLPREPLGAA